MARPQTQFCTGGSEIGHLRRGSNGPEIFSFHCTFFPIHLQEDKDNCFISCLSLLDNKSLSIIPMIKCLLCNKYLIFLMILFIFVCFCWLCLFVCLFLLVPLLLIIINHSHFSLEFCYFCCFCCRLSSFLGCMYSCS